MKSFEYTITDPVGIHARPAGILAKKAKEFVGSTVTIEKGGKAENVLKLMGVMKLGVKQGDVVTIRVEGGDEEAVASQVEEFFKANL